MTIKRAVIVGGTHGNEYCGAFLARHWLQHPDEIARDGFEAAALLANPEAHRMVRRYKDKDLNRCFRPESLAAPDEKIYEAGRAVELKDQLLGGHAPDDVAIFDLHTTTANMGASLVLGRMSLFNAALSAWLRVNDKEVRVYRWVEEGVEPGFLSGIVPAGLAIEVGPVPNGVLRADTVELTRSLALRCLDFIERWNAGERFEELELCFYEHREHVDFPRDGQGQPLAYVHPERQDRDWEPIQPGDPIFKTFAGETLTYDGPAGRVPVFINECAYYEKGIALTLTEERRMKVGDAAHLA